MKLSRLILTFVSLSTISTFAQEPAPSASPAEPPSLLAKLTDWMPGRPKKADERKDPTEITDFHVLYTQSCLGCHGAGKTAAGSLPMNDPLYLTIIPKDEMRKILINGIPGKPMPSFAIENGGSLTDKQIDILIEGIYAWAQNPPAANLPPYSAPLGNVASGGTSFAMYCASCHGTEGKGGKAGSVVDPAYLSLVSDQYLRTITMVGRPDLGCPDFMSRVPGKTMSNEEIGDVVAWLTSHRQNEFGQPLTAPAP